MPTTFRSWHAISAGIPTVIRITTRAEGSHTVVTIDGRVEESDVKELRRARKSAEGAVLLSLRGLDACAPAGVRLLRDWLDAGARLQDATPFLEMTLKDAPT